MAESNSQDVVIQSLSAGVVTPADVPATTSQSKITLGDEGEVVAGRENGLHTNAQASDREELALEDSTARSDTDTSRADGSNGDAKSADARPVKKFATSKPVSFAKYSVPKVIAANAAKAAVEKAPMPNTTISNPQLAGRPRLVAKTTSSTQQKVKPFRTAAPDPMQVWNKNRVTPQPSTKNLTDEELKQQYGIHLTSRLQTDGEGKEAKWADIDDDDEDDWAPETIEWGDGTKTTVNPADSTLTKSASNSKPSTPAVETPKSAFDTKPTSAFTTSIGPNATVLKLGANAERQQAQKAAQQVKGPTEKPSSSSSKSTPAPVPSKSPWAKLPPVEKVPPVDIIPQIPIQTLPTRYSNGGSQQPFGANGQPLAKEMSADDFSRGWKDSPTSQSRELFVPSSNRYELVPENRRRMSRNDQGFRAPAVLQRPGHSDPRAPEPSPAFQTTRTSSDVIRRRASSTISGESGQIARRMSLKSGDIAISTNESAIEDTPDLLSVSKEKVSHAMTPAYQARGGDYMSAPGQTDAEIQAQRAQQRELMKEQAELARKRRQEEEARLEAEKQERIRQKLLSLGPDPKAQRAEEESKVKVEAEVNAPADSIQNVDNLETPVQQAIKPERVLDTTIRSPPKPPQPTATGEPQQYGMMKVHPLDTIKKHALSHIHHPHPASTLEVSQNLQQAMEEVSPEPPTVNGVKADTDNGRAATEATSIPEPIPRLNRAVQEVRQSWVRNDHRSAAAAGNLWGAPHNKALGNGTFDHTLAGYAPQDLSSRASSTVQGWMNGKTPTVGQSPQLSHINQHVPETRSQALQNMTSPEPAPLAMNSEIDSMLPVRPPAPIAPPQVQQQQHIPQQPHPPAVNGYPSTVGQNNAAVAGWNDFHNVARAQERTDQEQYQRELAARREEEKRTGVRAQANYNFNETFKQVQLGQQPDQRHVNNVAQIHMPPPNMFGAVGSTPLASAIGLPSSRGSRFFPTQVNGLPPQERRAVTYSHVELSRSPSPPPAEEHLSAHPVFDIVSPTPIIRLPPEKAVVKLPPAKPPTPPAPAPTISTAPTQVPASLESVLPTKPLTWAARVSMPPPKSPAAIPLRAVSTPIVQNPSWQERFNGLLGTSTSRKLSDANQNQQAAQYPRQSQPALAVTSATKEPLDVMIAGLASVSLPQNEEESSNDEYDTQNKEVEDEEDLFEDREAGSLPTLSFPTEAPGLVWPRPITARVMPTPPDAQSAFIFLGSHWKEDKFPKQQFAIIRVPGNDNSVKKDLPLKTSGSNNATGNHRSQSRHVSGSSFRRSNRGGKARSATPVKTQ